MKKKEQLIENEIIQIPDIRTAIKNNDFEVIYYYLLKICEIPECFLERSY